MVYGDRRKYLTALITLNDHEAAAFAAHAEQVEQPPLSLADHPGIRQAVADHIEKTNRQLAPYEQIKRFAILPQDFTEAAGELTPTLKIRRREITKRYAGIIENLYNV